MIYGPEPSGIMIWSILPGKESRPAEGLAEGHGEK